MPRIVTIDDEVGVTSVIQAVLESEDYEVEAINEESQALDKIKENPPDLVLLDIKMPRMDGIEILMLIREFYPSIPVIMVSGYATDEDSQKSLDLGARGVVHKPLDVSELKRLVAECIQMWKSNSKSH